MRRPRCQQDNPRQFACEWCGPATLTIGGTLQSALPRNELRTASRVDDTIMSPYPRVSGYRSGYAVYPPGYGRTIPIVGIVLELEPLFEGGAPQWVSSEAIDRATELLGGPLSASVASPGLPLTASRRQ